MNSEKSYSAVPESTQLNRLELQVYLSKEACLTVSNQTFTEDHVIVQPTLDRRLSKLNRLSSDHG